MRLEDSREDDDCEAIGDKIAGNGWQMQGSFTSANASRLQNYSVYVVDIPYFCLFVYPDTLRPKQWTLWSQSRIL